MGFREHHYVEESTEFDEGYGSPIAAVRPDEDEMETESLIINEENSNEVTDQIKVKTCKEKCRRIKKHASSLVFIKKPLILPTILTMKIQLQVRSLNRSIR